MLESNGTALAFDSRELRQVLGAFVTGVTVITTLDAEAEALRMEARSGGTQGLIDAVAARSRPEGPGLYYLTGGAGQKLAGNLIWFSADS